jgi:hypothetical protein
MGLGLAIVRNAVLAHGGNVSAKNVAPHGLEVELRVPILPPSQPTRSDVSSPQQGSATRAALAPQGGQMRKLAKPTET